MARLSAVLLSALLAAACGGKNKGPTTPDPAGNPGSGESMNNTDPGAGPADPGQPGGADPGQPGDDPAQPGDEPGDVAGPGTDDPGPPAIEPPNLDLPADAKQKKVAEHLSKARAALSGASKNPDAAIAEAKLALEADATSIDAVAVMAHAYHAKKLYDTAEVILDLTFNEREAAKSNPAIYYVYGLIYDDTDRAKQAVLAYEKAVQLSPDYASALVNLGAHYLRNKQYAEAVRTYEKVTQQLNVQTALTYTNLGSAYRGHASSYQGENRSNLLLRALNAYKRAIDMGRDYGPAYYNLGLLYLDAEEFPGENGSMDKLARLEQAKLYFEEYRTKPGADIAKLDDQVKLVDKLIKREQKARKKPKSDDDW